MDALKIQALLNLQNSTILISIHTTCDSDPNRIESCEYFSHFPIVIPIDKHFLFLSSTLNVEKKNNVPFVAMAPKTGLFYICWAQTSETYISGF